MDSSDSDSGESKVAVDELLTSVPDYMQKVACDTEEWTPPFICAVASCPSVFIGFKNISNTACKFHVFPTNKDLCHKWKQICKISESVDVSEIMVCSNHFTPDDYVRNYKEEFSNPNFKRQLKPTAVPSQKLEECGGKETKLEKAQNMIAVAQSSKWYMTNLKSADEENKMLKSRYSLLLACQARMKLQMTQYHDRKVKKAASVDKLCKTLNQLKKQGQKRPQLPAVQSMGQSLIRKVFTNSQIKVLMGKKKVRWTDDDLARAFTMRHMGGKECYLYLKNTLKFPLPALSCVQKWVAARRVV